MKGAYQRPGTVMLRAKSFHGPISNCLFWILKKVRPTRCGKNLASFQASKKITKLVSKLPFQTEPTPNPCFTQICPCSERGAMSILDDRNGLMIMAMII